MTEQKQKKDEYQKTLSAYEQAMRAFRKVDYPKAVELFKAFLEKFPQEIELVDRANVYIKICEGQKKPTVSVKTLDDCLQFAVLKMNEGAYEESLKLLNKALEMDPQEGSVFYLMAVVYHLKGDTDSGLDHLKKAIQIDKKFQMIAQNEPDLEGLWEDKKFILLTRMK